MGCGLWAVGSCGYYTSTPQYTGITPVMGLWVVGCGLWVMGGHRGILLPMFVPGARCVIMSDYIGEEMDASISGKFNLFSKKCADSERIMLCEVTLGRSGFEQACYLIYKSREAS